MARLSFRRESGTEPTAALSGWMRLVLPGCLLGVPLLLGIWIGQQSNRETVSFFIELNAALEQELDRQRAAVSESKQRASAELQSVAVRVAEMQARLVRIEALGSRLTDLADIDPAEFDFSQTPAVGGVEYPAPEPMPEVGLLEELARLENALADRQMQLELLNDLMLDRNTIDQSRPSFFPVDSGWISSRYGNRIDPFTGAKAWHNGIDIAGRKGDSVYAVAAGVVSNVAEEPGLGKLVEITHEGGFVTRYGHNEEITVSVGDLVMKGDPIALMGSTGRSTGVHVHLEVYKNGRSVDPASYIQRYTR